MEPYKELADALLQKEKSEILVMVFDNLKTAEIWLRSMYVKINSVNRSTL